jgi:quercetin dioxygenase-like cupin family protein
MVPCAQERALSEIIRTGSIELRFLRSKHDTDGSLDLFEMIVPPTGRMPVPHYHRDWDETVYRLSGTVTFTVDNRAVDIGAGDTLYIARGIVHGFENHGSAPAKCLVVLTPGVLGPEYFREMSEELGKVPPDQAKMRAIMNRYGLIPILPA